MHWFEKYWGYVRNNYFAKDRFSHLLPNPEILVVWSVDTTLILELEDVSASHDTAEDQRLCPLRCRCNHLVCHGFLREETRGAYV